MEYDIVKKCFSVYTKYFIKIFGLLAKITKCLAYFSQ